MVHPPRYPEGAMNYIPSKMTKPRPLTHGSAPTSLSELKNRNPPTPKSKAEGHHNVELRFRKPKREVQRELQAENNKYLENLFTTGEVPTESIKIFWPYVKHRRADTAGIRMLTAYSPLITTTVAKARALNDHFQSSTQSSQPLHHSMTLH